MLWDIKYISWIFCHKTNVCTLINIFTYVQPDDFYLTLYLQVALLVSFPELPSGGPELGVNLALIIVVLGQVIHLVIILVIIIIIIPVFLFLFLFFFLSLLCISLNHHQTVCTQACSSSIIFSRVHAVVPRCISFIWAINLSSETKILQQI